jgi:hypothetical protein
MLARNGTVLDHLDCMTDSTGLMRLYNSFSYGTVNSGSKRPCCPRPTTGDFILLNH